MCKDPEDGKYTFTNIEGKKALEIKKRQIVDLNGSRSNTARWDAMKEMGMATSKIWLTSGGGNVRPSHQEYEAMGDVEIDYKYAPGLKYPGDPHCKDLKELDGC